MDRNVLFDIIYAMAARSGREQALFGKYVIAARQAFERSLAGSDLPEIWFELPLLGKPWLDVHALTSHEDARAKGSFGSWETGGNPEVFDWFAAQEGGVRQLALSWDTLAGSIEAPAVQLLTGVSDADVTCGFLKAAGREDAVGAYRAFVANLPAGWFACYAGVFPTRPEHNLRVECVPNPAQQRGYADDAGLLEKHLRQVGLDCTESIASRCQDLARTPFQLEFQFDVDRNGKACRTFGASLRFNAPPGTSQWPPFSTEGAAEQLMSQVEGWRLADDRWRLLEDASFATRVNFGDESQLLFCYPAFLKLRWRDGRPLDAKAYLVAGSQGTAAFTEQRKGPQS